MQIKIEYKDNGIAVYDYEDSQNYVKLLTTIFDEAGVKKEDSNIRSVAFITDKITVIYHDLGMYTNGEGESYCTFNKLTVIPQNELPIQLVY